MGKIRILDFEDFKKFDRETFEDGEIKAPRCNSHDVIKVVGKNLDYNSNSKSLLVPLLTVPNTIKMLLSIQV